MLVVCLSCPLRLSLSFGFSREIMAVFLIWFVPPLGQGKWT